MKILEIVAASLLVIGSLNWGLVGLLEFDVFATLSGSISLVTTTIYLLVGIAALDQVAGLPWIQKRWTVCPRLVPAG
jgi:uncharacterized membrane protein YuzA (DUF378 family)